MTMAKPVTIAGIEFKTQKEAVEHTRGILDRGFAERTKINNGRFTNEEVALKGDDLKFAKALLRRHPRYEEKKAEAKSRKAIGICVAPNQHGSRCFYILTKKRPMVEFSYLKCIRNGSSKPKD